MSDTEQLRNDAGQFTGGGEHLTGEAYEMHKAGYSLKPEEAAPTGPTDASELAADFTELRGPQEVEAEPEAPPEPADPDAPKEALTQRQLVEELADRRQMHESIVERRDNEEVAAYADLLRAELLGIKDEPTDKESAPKQPVANEAETSSVEGLAPDLEKALKHPQVRQAVEAEIAEAGKTREAYSIALQTGQQMLQATVAALAPQLEGLPLEHWPQAIQALAQIDPVRANLVAETLNKWGALQQEQQHEHQRRSHEQQQQFIAFKASEEAKLAEVLGPDSDRIVREYQTKVGPYFKSLGMSDADMHALAHDRTLHSAVGQRVLLDAMRYQEIANARAIVTARPVPPVLRPGVARSPAEVRASAAETKTARARDRINSGKGDSRDLASLLGSLRR